MSLQVENLFARGGSDGTWTTPSPTSSSSFQVEEQVGASSKSPAPMNSDPFSSSAMSTAGSLLPDANHNIQPERSTMSTRNTNSISFQALGALLLLSCIFCAVLCLVAPSCVQSRRRRRHRYAAMQRAAAAAEDSNTTTSTQNNNNNNNNNNNTNAQQREHNQQVTQRIRRQPAEERYANIEAWLVSKTVTAHDAVCDRAIRAASKSSMSTSRSTLSLSSLGSSCSGDGSGPVEEDNNSSNQQQPLQQNQNSDNSWSECPICFDTIEPGDVVSWSPQPDCGHVFHHECIKEWLLKNHNCPFCRQTCLPIDAAVETNKKQIMELLRARQHRDIPCFYCAEHGVVRPPNHLLSSNNIVTKKAMGLRSNNKNADSAFHESLHERSHQTCCRTKLQRLRSCTVGTEDDLFTDLELQAASAYEHRGSPSTVNSTVNSSSDGSGSVDDDEDHRETFRELPR